MSSGLFARLLVRYLSGFIIAKGLLSPEDGSMLVSDPDIQQLVEIGIGLGAGAAVEMFYFFAKKWGWTT